MSEQSQVVNITTVVGGEDDMIKVVMGVAIMVISVQLIVQLVLQEINRQQRKRTDGRLLTCKSCGSFRHLIGECPDSWENLAKVHVVEDEHFVLFTSYHKGEVATLGADARNCAVLDSACSSTVCGENWVKSFIGSLETL